MKFWPTFLGAALLIGQGCLPQGKVAFYGERTTVHSLAIGEDELFAATKGGLVRFKIGEAAQSFGWTTFDDVWIDKGVVSASGAGETWRWQGLLVTGSGPSRRPESVVLADGVWAIPARPVWPVENPVEPPAESLGTHVTAVAESAKGIIAAWYGDGLWHHDGSRWTRLPDAENKELRHVRCVATRGDEMAVATHSGVIWWKRAGTWHRLPLREGPDGSVYALASLNDKVFAGTFENGTTVFDGKRWASTAPPVLSSVHARHMVVFQGRLYVRQTTGEVDRFDGSIWTRNVFPWLLRGASTCLGVGDGKLLVGQFGGWSEFDGTKWEHHLKHPELQGFVATALAARSGEVWIGSQERGVFRYDRRLSTLRVYDQRHGFKNDWVRHILIDEGGVKVGMFITGAYSLKSDAFVRLTPDLSGEATGLVRHPRSRALYVGSREGLWKVEGARASRVPIAGSDPEIQTLMATKGGLWLGLPNGAVYAPWDQL